MRFKLIPRFLLFAGLCICLTIGELRLSNGLASNTGRIVFTSFRDGNGEIYVMDADGGNQENLTNNPANDSEPDWSADGTKIAFVSSRDGGASQIHIMDADGKNVIRLTDGRGGKRDPDWSPDGGKIAFTVQARPSHIAVMDVDGKNREMLVDQARKPSWSPDGEKIAFVSERGAHHDHDIFVIGAHGQGLENVKLGLGGVNPSFSPEGRRIAYLDGHKGFSHIYVIDTDGTDRKRLTHNEEHHWGPAWSSDGRTIAYYVWDKNLENPLGTIHLMTADGRYIRQLSQDRHARDFEPDISPLGLAVSPTSKTTVIWGRLKQLTSNLR